MGSSILTAIVQHKRKEVERRKKRHPINRSTITASHRDFAAAIGGKELSVIAEVKRASPSAGMLARKHFSPVEIARRYVREGASAISVLCDEKYFGGSPTHLRQVARAVAVPVLCKDFIIDEYQIYEARQHGADAILLIAAILTKGQIRRFLAVAHRLGMAVICEVHSRQELESVLDTPACIIGINNRDIHTFDVRTSTTRSLAKKIPRGKVIISESGLRNRKDMDAVRNSVDAVLVGTALMKGARIRDLVGTRLKICGVRSVAIAKGCEKFGVDYIGLNFVPTSRRRVSLATAAAISHQMTSTATVGVFQDQSISEVNRIARTVGLDHIQLSGNESIQFVRQCCRPVIKTVSVRSANDLKKAERYLPHVRHILLDGLRPGSGGRISVELKSVPFPFILAGGITPLNVASMVRQSNPVGVDVASGVETNEEIDLRKVRALLSILHAPTAYPPCSFSPSQRWAARDALALPPP